DRTWPTIAPQFCNGTRQSPINIVSANASENANLTEFIFQGYNSITAMTKIANTGETGLNWVTLPFIDDQCPLSNGPAFNLIQT
ncbi:hypothetical protein GOODEAATRI_034321, partial [Goodea atripinnis]